MAVTERSYLIRLRTLLPPQRARLEEGCVVPSNEAKSRLSRSKGPIVIIFSIINHIERTMLDRCLKISNGKVPYRQ
jgi:hypothetical protein